MSSQVVRFVQAEQPTKSTFGQPGSQHHAYLTTYTHFATLGLPASRVGQRGQMPAMIRLPSCLIAKVGPTNAEPEITRTVLESAPSLTKELGTKLPIQSTQIPGESRTVRCDLRHSHVTVSYASCFSKNLKDELVCVYLRIAAHASPRMRLGETA